MHTDTIERYADEATAAYLACALWSSTHPDDDHGDLPMDEHYTVNDCDPETLDRARDDVRAFVTTQWSILQAANVDASQCGHDFWLTRNGHGVGFWDRGLGAHGDTLTIACETFGPIDLYVGDDDRLYFG